MDLKIYDSLSAADETERIFDDFNGSLDDIGESDAIIEAKSGKADLRVSKGKSVILDSITKDSDGGITNIKVAADASLSVDGKDGTPGVINALGKLTTGTGSSLWLDKIVGTHNNTTISIGKKNLATFEEGLDLMGGSNTFSVGGSSDVQIFSHFRNIGKLKLASGTEDVPTFLIINDHISMSDRRNSITLGNHAVLRVQKNLDNDDVNTGTVIKAGKNSVVYFDNMFYVEKITMAAGSSFGIGGMSGDGLVPQSGALYGTSKSNTFSFGADMKGVDTGDKNIHIGEVDMKGGRNTFSIGSGTVLFIDNTYDVTKDPVTQKLVVTLIQVNDMYNVTNLKLASGKSDNHTELHVGGYIIGSDYKNKITLGNYTELRVKEKVCGFDNIRAGKNALIEILNAIEFSKKITVGADSFFYAGDITGTEMNDTLSFGRNNEVEIKNIDFGDGRRDTLSIGKETTVRVKESISGVDTIRAAGSSIIAGSINDTDDIKLDDVSGSWKKAAIYDTQNDLTAGTAELSGEVYGNEWDVYSFDCNESGCKELNLSDFAPDGQTEFELYRHNENGTFDKLSIDDWSETITGLDGRYSLLVHVEDADFKKDGENDYSFKVTLA